MAAKSTWDFDIHPLLKLSVFVEDVNVAVRRQNEDFEIQDRNPDEYLLSDFR